MGEISREGPKRRKRMIIALIAVLILIHASIAVYLIWSAPRDHASGIYDLYTRYEYNSTGNSSVILFGKVFNTGHKDGYLNITVHIEDQRGYSVSADFALGMIESDGGFAEVNGTYYWQKLGFAVNDDPANVLPLRLTVFPHWTEVEE